MEVRLQGKCGPMVKNVGKVLRQVQQRLQDQQGQWVAHLRSLPIWKRIFIEPFKT